MSEIKEENPQVENEDIDVTNEEEVNVDEEVKAEDEADKLQSDLNSVKEELDKQKKEYMFLLAEFDNFRKRTLKEKSELIKNAAEKAMEDILPVVDDFERALDAMHESTDVESVKEGVDLIYNKFVKYLENNGVKAIESNDAEFDTEYHEAVTTFPTDDESKKGKIIDTVQKGYMIHDKVLRHSKVVVGQ